MRKISLKGLEKKLKDLVHAEVFRRDKSICQWCGKYVEGSNRHPSHVIPKARGKIYRWDLLNIKTLCFHCHMQRWHLESNGREWFDKKFPERAKYLKGLKLKKAPKYNRAKLEEMIEEAKQW